MNGFYRTMARFSVVATLSSKRSLLMFGLGISLVVVGQIAFVGVPLALGQLVNQVALGEKDIVASLGWVAVYILLLIVGQASFDASDVVWFSVTERLKATVGVKALQSVLKLPDSGNSTSGEILEIVERGAESIATTVEAVFFRIVPKAIALLVILITISSNFTPSIGALTAAGGAVYIVWIFALHPFIKRSVVALSLAADKRSSVIVDFLSNRRVFWLYPKAIDLVANFQNASENNRRSMIGLIQVQSVWSSGNSIIIAFVTGLALTIFLFDAEQIKNIGGVVSLTYLVGMIFAPVGELSSGVQTALTEKSKYIDLEALLQNSDALDDGLAERQWSRIELEDFVALNAANSQVHSPVNLVIERGDKIVVRGPTGAGKTSFLDALTGGRGGSEGLILADGVSVPHLRDLARYVPQQDLLFNIGLSENVGFKTPDQDRLLRALQSAAITEPFLSRVLDNPVLGEAGSTVSGGERRRLSIARGLYEGDGLLFLDEPLAGLDSATQDRLLTNLLSNESLTIIMVCHHPEWWDRFNKTIDLTPSEL